MPYDRRRVDANQPIIVPQLRKLGISVQPIHTLGHGVPDLLLGVAGTNLLVELKSNGKGKLTDDELEWQVAWQGQVDTASSVAQILRAVLGHLSTISTHRAAQEHWRLSRALEHELEEEKARNDAPKPDSD